MFTDKGNDSVPPEKRFYLEIVYPMESKVQPKLMFFNANATVGKVLDKAADAGGIENKNNQMNAEVYLQIELADQTTEIVLNLLENWKNFGDKYGFARLWTRGTTIWR